MHFQIVDNDNVPIVCSDDESDELMGDSSWPEFANNVINSLHEVSHGMHIILFCDQISGMSVI